MASTKRMKTKDGREYYRIRVSMGRGKTVLSYNWYIPEGWSQKAIERELQKVAVSFEQKCKSGEIMSRSERKAIEEETERAVAAEAARIQTFQQYGERVFMPAKKITRAEKTRAYYQGALDNHLYPAFGPIPITELSSAQITAFFLSLQETKLSHSTINGVYVTLNQLLKMAYRDETIDRNPMDKVQPPKARKGEHKREVEAFTADELKTLNGYLEAEPLKWRAMIRLMEDTGIRRGEACALRWENVDLDNCSALIKENACYTTEKGLYIDTPKTDKGEREVYFTPAVSAILREYRAEQIRDTRRRADRLEREGKPIELDKIVIPSYVFTQQGTSGPMHPDSPNRYLRKLGQKYGIEIHPHKLRHSFASVAITNGADIASVSEFLGHAQVSTTLNMYTHANEESKRRCADLVRKAVEQA